MKKIISVALTLVLLVSMSAIAITSVSAGTTATINGKSANVGDKVTYNLYFKSEKLLENFQAYISFDSTVLKLQKFEMPSTSAGSMYNTTYTGFVYYTGSVCSPNSYDFKTEKVLVRATFTVSKAGTCNIVSVWEAAYEATNTALSPSILNEDGTLSSVASERAEVSVSSQGTTTKPTATTKPTTATTQKITTATQKITTATQNTTGTGNNPTVASTTKTTNPKPTSPTTATTVKPTTTEATVTTTASEPVSTVKTKVKVAMVVLNAKTKSLNKGKSFTLKATCKPRGATNKSVEWSTSNKKVATVSKNGKVTAKSKGVAYIKAKAKDGSKKSAKCKIIVKQPVTKVKLSVKNKTLKLKKKFKIKATVSPVNASDKKIKWTVSKKNIIKISSTKTRSGHYIKVTAKKKGKVNLIATAADGSKKSAKCKITVKK